MTKDKKAEADRLTIAELLRQSSQWGPLIRPGEDPIDTELRILFNDSQVRALLRFQDLCERMDLERAWAVAHGGG